LPKSPVIQETIKRTVNAVRAVGLLVMRVEVAPDGTVAVYPGVSGGKEPPRNSVDEALDEALSK
jgi:hypothetical protein